MGGARAVLGDRRLRVVFQRLEMGEHKVVALLLVFKQEHANRGQLIGGVLNSSVVPSGDLWLWLWPRAARGMPLGGDADGERMQFLGGLH